MEDGRRHRLGWSAVLIAAALAAGLGGTVLFQTQGPTAPSSHSTTLRGSLPSPADPGAWTSCTSGQLPMGGNRDVVVVGGDSTGRWQIGTAQPGGQGRAVVWHDGKLVGLAGKDHAAIILTGINSSGVAVGTDQSKDIAKGGPPVDEVPYVYRNGVFSKLHGGNGRAVAINDAGVIVGELDLPGVTLPVRWKSLNAQPELLRLPAGTEGGGVSDIAADGTIAGYENTGPGYLWRADGTMQRIDPPTIPGIPATGTLTPARFRFGWLIAGVQVYYYDPVVNASRAPSDRVRGERGMEFRYRPQPPSWELLSDGIEAAPEGEAGTSPGIWVGHARRSLPPYQPAVKLRSTTYVVPYISEDGHTAAGTAGAGDPASNAPSLPIIWRCR